MKSIVFHAVVSGILALNFLALGLRGVITKKPFIIPERWVSGVPFICFALILIDLDKSLWPDFYGLFQNSWAVMLLFFGVMWQQMRGYMVIGLTDESFRDLLHHSLNKLYIPFEESLSGMRLPSLEAELQVFAQSWAGSAQIRLKPKQQRTILKQIAAEMSAYFPQTSVRTNLYTCVLYTVIGVTLIVVGTMLIQSQLSSQAALQALREVQPR